MTEAEISALNQTEGAPSSSSSPPTTTAPEGAPMEEVKAGMQPHHHPDHKLEEGNAPYAEGGSLAKALAKEKEEKEAKEKEKEKGKGKGKVESEKDGGEEKRGE